MEQSLREINFHIQAKEYDKAYKLTKTLTESHPKSSQVWMTQGFICYCLNNFDEGVNSILKAIDNNHTDITFRFQILDLLEAMHRPDLALKSAKWLSDQDGLDARMYEKLAHILEMNQDYLTAMSIYQKMFQAGIKRPKIFLNMARICLNIGDINSSLSTIKQGLKEFPDDASMLYFKSYLTNKTDSKNDIDLIQRVIDTKRYSTIEGVKLHYALAKELEDCHKFEQSFNVRKIGAQLFRSSFSYDVNSEIEFMERIQHVHTMSFVNNKSQETGNASPVFIVGMPRTGSTLLDRIISNHSQVTSAGELVYFNDCIQSGLKSVLSSGQVSRLDMVDATVKLNFDKLGAQYLAASHMFAGKGKYFIDKLPQNSHYLGLILKSLPNAKILILRRNPVATCYAVYKQLFNTNAYPYSYDLDELVDYFIAHERLLNHWENIGGSSVKGVFYEELVKETETNAKSVCEFLGLEWEPNCLNFHKNKQAVATASSSQVREKIYTNSIDTWKHYKHELASLIKKLESAGCI